MVTLHLENNVWCFLASLTTRSFFSFPLPLPYFKDNILTQLKAPSWIIKVVLESIPIKMKKYTTEERERKVKCVRFLRTLAIRTELERSKCLIFFYFCFWHHSSILDTYFHFYFFPLLDLFSFCLIFHWLYWTFLTAWELLWSELAHLCLDSNKYKLLMCLKSPKQPPLAHTTLPVLIVRTIYNLIS